MKIISYFIVIFATFEIETHQSFDENSYTVVQISAQHDYHIIYALKDNIKYKIVSKKTRDACVKIQRNQEYMFKLREVEFLGGGEVNCASFDKRTVICKCDDEDCAYGLFIATNLQGLCIVDG